MKNTIQRILKSIKRTFTPGDSNDLSDGGYNTYIRARLNDKVGPIDRGDIYEDPLDAFLQDTKAGEVTGGGTQQSETGEFKYCEIEILCTGSALDKSLQEQIINKLENSGAPKGSLLLIEQTEEKIPFGKLEGLGLYLNGRDLDPQVYQSTDINEVIEDLRRLTKTEHTAQRYWEGESETCLYFYGDSFETLRNNIADYVAHTPICEKSRIEQVA